MVVPRLLLSTLSITAFLAAAMPPACAQSDGNDEDLYGYDEYAQPSSSPNTQTPAVKQNTPAAKTTTTPATDHRVLPSPVPVTHPSAPIQPVAPAKPIPPGITSGGAGVTPAATSGGTSTRAQPLSNTKAQPPSNTRAQPLSDIKTPSDIKAPSTPTSFPASFPEKDEKKKLEKAEKENTAAKEDVS